jgi:hypothetical protein
VFDTEEAWLICINNVDDPADCGPRPAPTPPPGGDTGGSTGGDTGGSTGGDTGGSTGGDTGGSTGGDTGGSTGGDTGGSTGGDTGGSTGGGSTGGDPPTPPLPPPQCANGKHGGHSVGTSGNANGHVCGGDSERHGLRHRHDHGRHLGHAAKAKAAVHQFEHWCQSFVAPRGRH